MKALVLNCIKVYIILKMACASQY